MRSSNTYTGLNYSIYVFIALRNQYARPKNKCLFRSLSDDGKLENERQANVLENMLTNQSILSTSNIRQISILHVINPAF